MKLDKKSAKSVHNVKAWDYLLQDQEQDQECVHQALAITNVK